MYVRKQRSRKGDFGLPELCQCWREEERILNSVLYQARQTKSGSNPIQSSQNHDDISKKNWKKWFFNLFFFTFRPNFLLQQQCKKNSYTVDNELVDVTYCGFH